MNALVKVLISLLRVFGKGQKKKNNQVSKPQKKVSSVKKTGNFPVSAAPITAEKAKLAGSLAVPSAVPSAVPTAGPPAAQKPVSVTLCETCGSELDPKLWFCLNCGQRTALAEPVFSSASEAQRRVSDFKYSRQSAEKKAAEYAALNIQKEGDFLFRADGDSAAITGFVKLNANVQIPSVIGGLAVTEIGDKAFSGKGITGVTIPSGVKRIGEWAFSKNALTSVTIPGTAASVGKFAFANNAFTSIVIENGVQSVGEGAFEKQTRFSEEVSTVANIVIPGSMAKIGESAFARSRIGSVTLSPGVKTIGECAFMGNQFKSVTFPDGVTEIGKNAFDENFIESVSFPGSLIKIGEGAFSNSRLTSVNLPPNLKTLGEGAFSNNKITEIEIPGSVKKIGNEAFSKNALKSIKICEGVETIGKNAFSHNKFEKVEDIPIPSSIKVIDEEAFSENKICGNLTVPETVEKIGKNAFIYNKLTGVMIRGKTDIGESAFCGNEINKVILGRKVPSAGNASFCFNKIIGVTVPDGVKVSGEDSPAGTIAPFDSSIYFFRGDTDNLKFDDSAYWTEFERKINADIEAKKPVYPVICHGASGNKIGSIEINSVRGGIIIFDAKYKDYIARIFFRRTSHYANLGIQYGVFSTDRGEIIQLNGGMVTAEGIVLQDFKFKFVDEKKGVIKSTGKDEAEKFRIGNVKVEGGTGIAYDKNGVKAAEVRNCGQHGAALAAAVLRFIIKQ